MSSFIISIRRQICFIVILLGCSVGFSFAQSTQPPTYENLIQSRTKPLTIREWIDSSNTIATYRSTANTLKQGGIFEESYVVQVRRDSDMLRDIIISYREELVRSQETIEPGGSTNECSSLTSHDVASLASTSNWFRRIVGRRGLIQLSEYNDADLNTSCRRRVSCVGGSTMITYNSMTQAQNTWPLCRDRLINQLVGYYDTTRSIKNLSLTQTYTNIFADANADNGPFDIAKDMHEIMLLYQDTISSPRDTTSSEEGLGGDGGLGWESKELLASTQQLINALEINTTIDPRQDQQIIALINQINTSPLNRITIATGNILNMCADQGTIDDQKRNILQQLRSVQQRTSSYNQSLDIRNILNLAIDGTRSSSAAIGGTLLSSNRTLSNNEYSIDTPSLVDSPVGQALDSINETDLPNPSSPVMVSGANVADTIIQTGSADVLRQCLGSCSQQYGTNSRCSMECEDVGGIGAKRACQTKCNNKMIACRGQCLCSSTATVAQMASGSGSVSKLHENFELRWCLVPTNKLRTPTSSACIRKHPETGIVMIASLECYVDLSIAQGNYNRDSGKGGIRKNPTEHNESSLKFDLPSMIDIGISTTARPLPSNPNIDVDTAILRQEYAKLMRTSFDSTSQGSSTIFMIVQSFLSGLDALWKNIDENARDVTTIVSQ